LSIEGAGSQMPSKSPPVRAAPMTRDEFVGYLAARAEALRIPLHRAGELAGLPREFHQALAVARLLDALGQPAPSGELLRTWYGRAAWASADAARWVYGVVGSLRDPDLEQLDLGELLSFWVRFDTWGAAAHALARDVRRQLRAAP
jgi:hypothetical protein